MDTVELERRGKASRAIGGRDGIFRALLSKVVGLGGQFLPSGISRQLWWRYGHSSLNAMSGSTSTSTCTNPARLIMASVRVRVLVK